jgi:hypothetical protein
MMINDFDENTERCIIPHDWIDGEEFEEYREAERAEVRQFFEDDGEGGEDD